MLQPGGRAPAPAELATVQAFINSHYDLEHDHGAELLASPPALHSWLTRHDLLRAGAAADAADLLRALELRESLRELARANGGPAPAPALHTLNRLADGASVELRFSAAGPRFALSADSGAAGAVGLLLAITARAMIEGTWGRLKICPADACGWAFYDHSRNQTGRWCSMSVCGGRAKARSHYRRRRATA